MAEETGSRGEEIRAALAACRAFAEAHERWDAELFESDEAWEGNRASNPRLTDALLDGHTRVQEARNEALRLLKGMG